MTHNQIEYRKAREQERANQASEALKSEENQIKKADVIVKGANGAAKSIAGVFNDVSWYKKNPQLLKDTANLSFSQAAAILKEDGLTFKGLAGETHKTTKTNVLRLGFIPVLGKGTSPRDNLTVAIRNIFTNNRYKNAGHVNYEAPDLGMFIGAMDSIYTALAWMQRVYKTAMMYNPLNRDLPAALLTAMGVSPEDIYQNLNDFRGYINKQIVKLESLYVPKTLPIFKRHIWMCDNVFKDSPIAKSSYYLFSPTALCQYDSENGLLKKYAWFRANQGATYAQIVGKFDTLVNSVYGDEDFNIMMGDMLKAYGESNRFALTEINEDLVLQPVFSEEVLSQIENYRCYGDVDSNDIVDQRIDDKLHESYIYCNPIMNVTDESITQYVDQQHRSVMINMHKGNVSSEDVVVATRMTTGLIMQDSDYLLSDFGTEIPTYMNLISYGLNYDSDSNTYSTKLLYAYEFTTFGKVLALYVDNDGGFTPPDMNILVNLSASFIYGEDSAKSVLDGIFIASILHYFDWAPIFIIPVGFVSGRHEEFYAEDTGYADFWDYDNYAVASYDNLHNIHEMCVLSELDVPAKAPK